MRIIRIIIVIVLMSLLLISACNKKKKDDNNSVKEWRHNISNLLPQKISACSRRNLINYYVDAELVQYINNAAKVYFTYGFQIIGTTEYVCLDSTNIIVVDIYQMSSPENAFGIYSYNRYKEATIDSTLGGEGFVSDYSIDFYDSNYYIHIQLYDTSEELIAQAKNIANFIDKKIVWKNTMPKIISTLPKKKKVEHSEKFIHEKIAMNVVIPLPKNPFLLSSKTNVAVAEYIDNDENPYNLFVISSPDTFSVERCFKNFQNFAFADSLSQIIETDSITSILIQRDGMYGFVKYNGELVKGGWNILNEELAKELFETIK